MSATVDLLWKVDPDHGASPDGLVRRMGNQKRPAKKTRMMQGESND